MNNRRVIYYPVLVYTFLLVFIWLLSWLVSIAQLLCSLQTTVHSLVGGDGVRWALLSIRNSLNAVPWGSTILLLLAVGFLAGSGFLSSMVRLISGSRISKNELRSLIFSVSVLLVYIAIVFMFTISPWQSLLGVTGDVHSSPLLRGWQLVVIIGVLLISLVFGFMYGNYRTLADVVGSASVYMEMFVPALVAMIPAAGILPCMEYSGLVTFLGLNSEGIGILENMLYMFPILYVVILWIMKKR